MNAETYQNAERLYKHVLCENKDFHRDHVWAEPLVGTAGGYTVRYCPGVMVIVRLAEIQAKESS